MTNSLRPRAVQRLFRGAACCVAAAALTQAAEGAEGDDTASLIDAALQTGRFTAQVRLRYAEIRESNLTGRTKSWTVRTTGGWEMRLAQDLRMNLEGIHTDHFGPKTYNDDVGAIGTSEYPLIPDPRNSDLNQAYLDWTGLPSTRVRAGKQLVRLGNQRFISDNDFRQTPTVFNGVLVTNNTLANTQATFGDFRRMRNALGMQAELRLTLFEAAHNPAPGHSVSGYGYYLDQPQDASFTGFANNSHRVLGVRAEGTVAAGDGADAAGWRRGLGFPYVADFAQQQAYAGGDSRIDARYWRLGAGVATANAGLRVDREVKGSNHGSYGLQTPLTDLYALNGWALQFTTTPPQGLEDTWATVRCEAGAFTFYGEAHRFRSAFGGLDYGRETDLSAVWTLRGDFFARIQHARFRPEAGMARGQEVDKTWVTFNYSY